MADLRFIAVSCVTWLACSIAAHAGTTNEQARAACAQEPAASRAACVREAGAAAQAARSGQLTSLGAEDYQRNALARCNVFTNPQENADCHARMGAQAIVHGSVDSGGELRESVRTYTVK